MLKSSNLHVHVRAHRLQEENVSLKESVSALQSELFTDWVNVWVIYYFILFTCIEQNQELLLSGKDEILDLRQQITTLQLLLTAQQG